MLLVKIQGNEAPGSEHRLSARILGPDLTYACEEMSLPFTSMNAPLLPDGWETGILFPIQLVFDVPAAGGYSVELSVDGGGSLTVPFVIQAVRPPTS